MASFPDPIITPLTRTNREVSPETIKTTDREQDLQKSRTLNEDSSICDHCERHSVFEDVTIPTNILRYVNTDREWTPNNEVVGAKDRHQADSSSNFNVVDIALEHQAKVDYALGNSPENPRRRSSRTKSTWGRGQVADWKKTSLPMLDEEKDNEARRRQRRSTSGMQAIRTTQRRSTGDRQGHNNVAFGPQLDNSVLFRSLDSYTFKDADGVQLRRLSSAVPPDADYFSPYEGSLEKDIDRRHIDDPMHATKEEVELPPESSILRRASVGLVSLYQTVTRGTTNLMRMSTLRNTYENAKIRGKHLERKKWVQVVFEYTFYLILACFVYFVLVGRPLWKGAVMWLYWIVNTRFTVAGTWSITIGLAFM